MLAATCTHEYNGSIDELANVIFGQIQFPVTTSLVRALQKALDYITTLEFEVNGNIDQFTNTQHELDAITVAD